MIIEVNEIKKLFKTKTIYNVVVCDSNGKMLNANPPPTFLFQSREEAIEKALVLSEHYNHTPIKFNWGQ